MNVQIRSFEIRDTQYILDIINYNILNSTALYDYKTRNFEDQKRILDEKINKGFPVIVAECDGKLVGFGMYSEFRFREAYKFTVEHSVYISPNELGKGFGKLIMAQLIELAKAQGLHTMIGVIDSENKSSILFHDQFGFKTVGIIKETGYKFDRWLDSVFMQLLLE
jgi:phosphinothricin acetyltransferase